MVMSMVLNIITVAFGIRWSEWCGFVIALLWLYLLHPCPPPLESEQPSSQHRLIPVLAVLTLGDVRDSEAQHVTCSSDLLYHYSSDKVGICYSLSSHSIKGDHDVHP